MLLRKEIEMATYSNWPASKPLNTAQIECIISGFTRRHTRDYDSPFPGNALRNHILQVDITLEKPGAPPSPVNALRIQVGRSKKHDIEGKQPVQKHDIEGKPAGPTLI